MPNRYVPVDPELLRDPLSPGTAPVAPSRLSRPQKRQSLQDFAYPAAEGSSKGEEQAETHNESQDLGLDPHDILGATLQADPDLLREQLDEVLGFSLKGQIWMVEEGSPRQHTSRYSGEYRRHSEYRHSSDSHSHSAGARRHSSERSPASRKRHSTQRSPEDPFLGDPGDPDLTYNIPMITLNEGLLPKADLYDPDLEAGLFLQPQHQKNAVPLSPAKILGLLTRISDRVAGSNNPATPAVDTHPDAFPASDLRSVHSASSVHSDTSLARTPVSLPLLDLQRRLSVDSINSVSLDEPDDIKSQVKLDKIYDSKVNLSRASSKPVHPKEAVFQETPELFGNSLMIFPPTSKFRQWCHSMASRRSTNAVILAMILAQSTVLIARQWSYGSHELDVRSNFADWTLLGINIFYTIEIAAKVVAYGFVNDTALFETMDIDYPTSSLWLAWHSLCERAKKHYAILTPRKRKKLPVESNLEPNSPQNPFLVEAELSGNAKRLSRLSQLSHRSENELFHKYPEFSRNNRNSVTSELDLSPIKRVQEQNTFLKTQELRRTVEEMNLKRAYLRSSWQRLDFISVVSFWISLLLHINRWDYESHFMLFRALGCIRIWRLLNLTTGTNIILRACQSAIPQLIDVGIFVVCFWFIFSIIGVQSFKSSLSRHCVWTNPDDPTETYTNSAGFCGAYLGTDGHPHPYLDRQGKQTGYVKGWRCPVNSVCQSGENPHGGTVNFDNVLQAMQVVFVVISVNTFSDTMYSVMDSDNVAAALFFIVGIFVLTVWLMNIFIAIIVASFDFVQEEEKEEKKRKAAAQEEGTSLDTRAAKLKSWFFNDGLYSERIRKVIERKPLLKLYYRLEFLFLLVITSSLIAQTYRSHGMKETRALLLYRIESVFTSILFAEIILRFFLYLPEWRLFFVSHRNVVDMGLAIITAVIILGPVKDRLGHAYYWMTFFQLARFYRVVLAFRVTSELWIKISKSMKAIYDLTLFYFILLILTSIIVSRYFEGTVPEADIDEVQFAMHTLPNTVMSLYVITSTENWANVMYSLQGYARNTAQRVFGAIILILWFFVSNLVVMNIFIAVIAKAFKVSLEGRRKHQLRQFIEDMTKRLLMVRDPPGWLFRLKAKWFKSKEEKNIEKAVTNLLLSGSAVNDFLGDDEEVERDEAEVSESPDVKTNARKYFQGVKLFVTNYFKNPFYVKKKKTTKVENFEPSRFATEVLSERRSLVESQDLYLKENPSFNTVFYMMEPDHILRRFCQKIVPSSFGERIDGVEPSKTVGDIFSMIMFASTIGIVVAACYLTPIYRMELQQREGRWNWSFMVDTMFQGIFTLELLIKVIADGLVFTPNAYARLPWNWLDFGALVSLWIEFIAYLINDGDLSRIVRGLKALRALRILTISETAKNNFHFTMLSGFAKILSAAIISLTLLFPFSVWGLNVFNGRLGYCVDGISDYAECFDEYANTPFNWDVLNPKVYSNPYLHMDNFVSSFSTFYQIVSLEGWTDLLINVMQSTGVGTPQEMFHSPINGLFIMFFNFVSTVFILTLFVSVIINNYAKVTGSAYLTDVQIQWYHVKKFLREVKPSKRRVAGELGRFRRFCYHLTIEKNSAWHTILGIVLVLHLCALTFETFPSTIPGGVRYALFFVSTSCFLVHYVMMVIALGYKVFVLNKWNVFCLLVTMGAFGSTCTGSQLSSGNMFVNFNKLFLVALLIFLFPRSDRLNQLLKFASASFPSLFSLLFTWFIIYIAYAIAMNQVFGLTKIGPNTSNNINLRSVPKALILLFRCSFGEGWNYIMMDFTVEEPYCTWDADTAMSDCGNKQYAYFFFISWNLVSMYIMLNLFISLILDSFSYIAGGKKYHHLIARQEIRKFKRAWEKFDPTGTGFIDVEYLSPLLRSLQGSLSFSFYHGSLGIPRLTSRWITRHSSNPYDISIDYVAINQILARMDVPKIQERRKLLAHFVEETRVTMELHEEKGISFTRLITQLPLYTAFDPGQCLVLIDFLENRLLFGKVAKRLKKERCIELIRGYACRWRFKQWKKGELSTEQFFKAAQDAETAEPDKYALEEFVQEFP